ncbi:Uncharacterized membrane protein [Clostridium cavendishii DSM 21758]|uniref:Uncharacterized membrane protein n=1 Tax=Clostridium cavendishii DSM 21758 TaxID=1121302 RepID=A0A1M6GYD4_9CLOT|nr:DUF979 domain-containing protein [Clostridium cavendishii]SHJ14932.1 Uncharacterized membrane protein [Clostridium cavendishii DSM 21758]
MFKDSMTELLYVACGLVCFYSMYITLKDKNHPSRIPTALFWGIVGFIFSFSRIGMVWGNKNIFVNDTVIGYLVLIMAILSAFKLVKFNKFKESTSEFKEKMSQKIGNKIFIPALLLGFVAFIVAQFWSQELGPFVALGIATIVSTVAGLWATKGKTTEMAEDGRRFLELMGPASILPQILAALGSLFTAAGVGNIIANGISSTIPKGNIFLGVVAYCVGMAIFTMIMGNAFAAFAVITAGVGVPFVFAQGGNPVIASALALTAGFCGTLITPMAANFNIVPTAILEMKDKKNGIIKYQLPVALVMLVAHIALMYFWAF